jgi:hypothetical protein
MPKTALALGIAAVALVTAVAFVPWLSEERESPVSTPATAPLFDPVVRVELGPGEEACLRDVALDPGADVARVRVGTFGRPGQPLELELSGAGYRERARAAGGYPDNAPVSFAIDGPDRSLLGRACIANAGDGPIALHATGEVRTRSRVRVAVEGREIEPDVALAFYERERRSVLELLPAALERMTAFRPYGEWLTWPLLVAVLLGVPALAFWSLWRAFGAGERDRPRA